jgi:antitoxin MazE
MIVSIVAIGNSKGIRIPKTILEQCKIDKEVELAVEEGKIVIEPIKKTPRKNWDKAFKEMKKNEEDKLAIDDSIDLEMDDWKWQ